MKFFIFIVSLGFITLGFPELKAQNTLLLNDSTGMYRVDPDLVYLVDKEGKMTLRDVMSPTNATKFIKSKKSVLAFGITNNTIWLKIRVKNLNPKSNRNLLIDEPEISDIRVYEPALGDKILYQTGFMYPITSRSYKSPDFIFPIPGHDTITHTYFIKVHSNRTLILPIFFITNENLFARESNKNVGYGIYFGIFAGLFFYNLILFLGLRDRAYLYYLFSILASFLMFASVTGYTLLYFFPASPQFNRILIEIGAAGLSIFSALFAAEFLSVKQHSRFLLYSLYACIVTAVFALVEIVMGNLYTVQNILYNLLSLQIFIMLACGIISYRKGTRYALYYIVAWLGYMIGGLLILVRDQGLLPYNSITTHSAEAGSALEIILLSLALSKRYQIYRREKEDATKLALQVQKEANETLEIKVTERTSELEHTLRELKSTQVQLIQAEKMASLGVMTAGVAHEVNNPVNYVIAGLSSLQQNYEDISLVVKEAIQMKEGDDNSAKTASIIRINKEKEIKELLPEMDELFKAVYHGAAKISNIVKGLRNFSRLDEGELKTVDLEAGLDATLTMLSEKMGERIRVIRKYGDIPQVQCLASQINQVFMNILYNAVDAISGQGEIIITTEHLAHGQVRISIKDSGTGIPDEIKSRIFDPFFTTKDVGKGSGLGLSVAYNIIKKHQGKLYFVSQTDGTEFIIELNLVCKILD